MASNFHCDIVSAEGEIFSGDVTGVYATGESGELGIMPNHAQLITRLKPGHVRVTRENEEEQFYYVSGGMMEVQPHLVTVLADTAIRGVDLDEQAATTAKEEAERALQDKSAEIDLAQAQAQLAEAIAQLQALQRLRKKLR